MSGSDLRTRIAEALADWQAKHATVCEHTQIIEYGAAADAVLAEVQHELDAKDAENARQRRALGNALSVGTVGDARAEVIGLNAQLDDLRQRASSARAGDDARYAQAVNRAEQAEASLANTRRLLDNRVQDCVDLTRRAEQAEAERDRLLALVRDAMTIRMYGERAPGGTENWADWDLAAETELRGLDGHLGDNEAESTLDIQRDRDRLRAAVERVREALPYLDGQITGLEQLRPETGDTFRKTFNQLRAALDQAPAEEASGT